MKVDPVRRKAAQAALLDCLFAHSGSPSDAAAAADELLRRFRLTWEQMLVAQTEASDPLPVRQAATLGMVVYELREYLPNSIACAAVWQADAHKNPEHLRHLIGLVNHAMSCLENDNAAFKVLADAEAKANAERAAPSFPTDSILTGSVSHA